jgi:hypothetical protein
MKTWLILGAVYIGFFFWYTDMGGKLSQEEIQIFIKKHEQNIINDGVSPDSEEFQLRIDFLKSSWKKIMVSNSLWSIILK